MKVFGVLLISIALVAHGESRSAGEATGNSSPSLNDLFVQAQTDIAKLGRELHKNLNLPDQATIVETLKSHSQNLVDNVKTYVSQVSDDVKSKSPEAERFWNSFKTAFNKAADDIAAQIPSAKDQVAQLEAKFLKGVETIVKQSELATQTINRNSAPIQEDFSKIAKKAVEIAVEATQQLNSQVQQHAIAKPKA